MPSRRQFVTAAGAALAALAGCADGTDTGTERRTTDSPTTRPTTDGRTDTATDSDTEPTTPDDEFPAWTPTWSLDTDLGGLVALTVEGGDLYATLSDDASRSAVAAVDRENRTLRWRRTFDGEAVTGSFLAQSNARDKWDVTVADDTLYVVTGDVDDYAWTALHALDRATGEVRWSVRRERELAVAGVREGTVVAGAREFFVPDSTHDTPEEPLTTAMLGVDAATGEVRWTREFDGVRAATTFAGGVAVGTRNGVTALALEGTERWSAATAAPRALLPVGETAVLAAEAGDDRSRLRAFAADGAERWRDERPVEEFLAAGDRLYALGDGTVAYGADGTVRWAVDGYGQWPLLAPDGETLYSRAGVRANAVDAVALPSGDRRFRWETPSDNGWPAGATDGMVVAEAITPEKADFTSLYAVDDRSGDPTAVYRPGDTVFDVAGVGDTAYAAVGSRLLAFGHP